jgi:TonB-dependent SusC/RagA subfamily outer membrane receptor
MKTLMKKGFAPVPPVLSAIALAAMLVFTGCASSNSSRDETAQNDENQTVDMGYGEVDKDRMTESVATIDNTDPNLVQPRSIADLLRGRVAGVTVEEGPGGSIRVRIRGQRSFMGGNDPLYVIDGMVINTSDGILSGINPMDIESISVLKDASATAAYGSRGANGVIVIKTKRGGS